MSLEPSDKRPTASERAEDLLASLDLSSEFESDLLRESFRRRAAHAVSHEGPIEMTEKARARREFRFTELVDGHLAALREFGDNKDVEIGGRFISDISYRVGSSETPDVVGLIELRARDGRSVIATETRLFPIDGGAAVNEGRSFHYGNGFDLRPLLAPRAFAAELEKLRSLAEQVRSDGSGLDALEQTSLLYHLIRGALANRHGLAASWYRDVGFIAPIGFPDNPGVSLTMSPDGQFIARPRLDPHSFRIEIETRAVTKH